MLKLLGTVLVLTTVGTVHAQAQAPAAPDQPSNRPLWSDGMHSVPENAFFAFKAEGSYVSPQGGRYARYSVNNVDGDFLSYLLLDVQLKEGETMPDSIEFRVLYDSDRFDPRATNSCVATYALRDYNTLEQEHHMLPYLGKGVTWYTFKVRNPVRRGPAGFRFLVYLRGFDGATCPLVEDLTDLIVNGLKRVTSVDGITGAPTFMVSAPRPNPVTRGGIVAFEVSNPHTDRVRVTLHDVTGREVLVLRDGTGPLEVNVETSALASGVYFLRTVGKGGVVTRPFIVR